MVADRHTFNQGARNKGCHCDVSGCGRKSPTSMSQKSWSIEGELCDLSGRSTLSQALTALGLIADEAALFDLGAPRGWIRSGAETYCYIFSIITPDRPPVLCRIKACVSFSPGSRLTDILDRWIFRRKLLAEAGVRVPVLYGAGKGILLEEEIPFSVSQALHSPDAEHVLSDLLIIAAALAKLKFAPVNAFGDIRSRSRDAVCVDFGSDLGEPDSPSSTPDGILSQLLEQLDRWSFQVTAEKRAGILEAFHARYANSLQ